MALLSRGKKWLLGAQQLRREKGNKYVAGKKSWETRLVLCANCSVIGVGGPMHYCTIRSVPQMFSAAFQLPLQTRKLNNSEKDGSGGRAGGFAIVSLLRN